MNRHVFHLTCLIVVSLLRPGFAEEVAVGVIRYSIGAQSISGWHVSHHAYRNTVPPPDAELHGSLALIDYPGSTWGEYAVWSPLIGDTLLVGYAYPHDAGELFRLPPETQFNGTALRGQEGIYPDSIFVVGDRDEALRAWTQVAGILPVQQVWEAGPFDVLAFRHGVFIDELDYDPWREWVFVLQTNRVLSEDLSIERALWPAQLVTQGVPVIPELFLHNFADHDTVVAVSASVSEGATLLQEEAMDNIHLPPQSSKTVTLPALRSIDQGSVKFSFRLTAPDGHPWLDEVTVNDTLSVNSLSVSNPVFRSVSSIRVPGEIPLESTPLDLDGDGDIDLFDSRTRFGARLPRLFLRQQDSYVDATSKSAGVFDRPAELLAAGDLNGDSFLDLVVHDRYGREPTPRLLVGRGEGAFAERSGTGLEQIAFAGWGPGVAADLDADGDLDLILLGGQVMENNGSAIFHEVTHDSGLFQEQDEFSSTLGVDTGDINGDGMHDVALAHWEKRSEVGMNKGRMSFSLVRGPWPSEYARDALFFDFDGDGLDDLLFARLLYSERSQLFLNEGNETFFEAPIDVVDPGDLVPAFYASTGDFNEDGTEDLLLGTTLLVNLGGRFSNETRLLLDQDFHRSRYAGGSPGDGQFIDFDGDGDLDVFSDRVVFENMGVPLHPTAVTDAEVSGYPPVAPKPYPNPSNSSVAVPFFSSGGAVHIDLYDVLGQHVARLFQGYVPTGQHLVVWAGVDDAGKAPSSGVYYIVGKGATQLKERIVLLK